jgi:hypothetical protein
MVGTRDVHTASTRRALPSIAVAIEILTLKLFFKNGATNMTTAESLLAR